MTAIRKSDSQLDSERLYQAITDELAVLWGDPSDGMSAAIRRAFVRSAIDRYVALADADTEKPQP